MATATFILEGIERQGGTYRAIGRCGNIAIGIGDVFTSTADIARTGPLESHEYVRPKNQRAVALRVERITAYGRAFEQLSAGMTAELILSGSGSPERYDVLRFDVDDLSERKRKSW
jgi:hypothetical protein